MNTFFCFAETRFIMMKRTQSLYLLLISGFCSFTLGSSDFHIINISKAYVEAKAYCREMYTDLATVHNLTDMNDLNALVPSSTARAWIGLEVGDRWMWHWSRPNQNLDFLNWEAGQPQNTDQDACMAMDRTGKWFESDCGTRKSFVCHGNSETSGPVFVAEMKTWRDAQSHCRDEASDLVSIQSAEENEAVRNLFASENVWTGLFKDPWQWSDESNSSFRHWKRNQPNYRQDQECVLAVFNNEGKWNDVRCSLRRKFVCRGARKVLTTTTQPTVAASTSRPNPTEATTLVTTASSERTEPTTTHLVSSTEGNNATTAQPSPTTTVQITTDGVSVLTTPMETSAQPTESSLLPGNLILIRENMTWIEAMNYCREHHVDLVHITTADIQIKAAEKARNATSRHVWLGLRYSCSFNFWFWITSPLGCYLNWAPGQGPEGNYDCGVTGAIMATGGQQWVGLPETERLNFLCYACAG